MDNLKEVLELHDKWLQDADGGVQANLSEAELCVAELCVANLRDANLRGANLSGANLRGANLRGANLLWANLPMAYLCGAVVDGAHWPSPTMVLLANWGEVSDELCLDLMRFDAACHGEPMDFDAWASGGPCPYGSKHYQRACNFLEKRELWSPGPAPTALELMARLLAEKCVVE